MAEFTTVTMSVGTGIKVKGENYVGLLLIGNGYWIAAQEGDALPATLVLVHEDCPECPE